MLQGKLLGISLQGKLLGNTLMLQTASK